MAKPGRPGPSLRIPKVTKTMQTPRMRSGICSEKTVAAAVPKIGKRSGAFNGTSSPSTP